MSDVAVLVGTQKGAFVLRSSDSRASFRLHGPHLAGELVYSVAVDGRDGRPRLLAGTTSEHWGSIVRSSDDGGATWSDPEIGNIKFPSDTGSALEYIWQVQPAGPTDPGVVYAGVQPAALFRSDDGCETFELVRGLWDHPERPRWVPGFGGLCLHSIVIHPDDPERMLVAISAGGVYTTDDGGRSWTAAHRGIHFPPGPDAPVESGRCVHRAARDPVAAETIYLQGHWGIYRSDDFGATWRDIGPRGPADFGFPLITHPRRTGTAYVIPLTSDEIRWPLDGKCRVYRTSDGGESWEPLSNGLPQDGAYFSILRDAFCHDNLDPVGLYFGTRSGEVYGSADEGESWRLIASHLPPVLSVRAGRTG